MFLLAPPPSRIRATKVAALRHQTRSSFSGSASRLKSPRKPKKPNVAPLLIWSWTRAERAGKSSAKPVIPWRTRPSWREPAGSDDMLIG